MSSIKIKSYYTYNGLQQVKTAKRGVLTGTAGAYTGITASSTQAFTFDQMGNWTDFDDSVTPVLNQDRTFNLGNEITGITNPTGVVATVFDVVGRMTTTPSPADWTVGYTLKWDAWSRLVEVKQGTTVVASYKYDALHRRISTTVGTTTRDFYYDHQWRAVEEQEGGALKAQYVWDVLDRWNLILRRRAVGSTALNENRWPLRDGLDPVALIDSATSAVTARLTYSAFGAAKFLSPTFGASTVTPTDWNFLFHGEFQDIETGMFNYGFRYYHAQLGRWLSRDPLGEAGGVNLYSFVMNQAPNLLDEYGLDTIVPLPIFGWGVVRPPLAEPIWKPKKRVPPKHPCPTCGGDLDKTTPQDSRATPCIPPHYIRDPQKANKCIKDLTKAGKRAAEDAGIELMTINPFAVARDLAHYQRALARANEDFKDCMNDVPCICPNASSK